jgi:CheY-like chemotaxis protein
LLALINEILDFSKIEAGKLEFESIPFEFRESLGETMKTLGFRAHQKGLELIYDVQPDVPEAILGDPGRLRQILVNLVGNAIKFTEHGEIMVHVELDSSSTTAACLHFSVRDTGVGIPAGKQEQIFEAFSQADGSMARKYGGSGLGLTICARLIGIMGGRIWVDSRQGQGSTFHFKAQFAIQETPALSAIPLEPEQLRGLTVLVVDDNFTNRRVLTEILKRWGVKPTAVDGGRAALMALEIAKSAGRPFPLILLDGQMPEIDGFTLARQIQANPELVGATIMMLTSADQLGDASLCRELGISAYIVKPIRQSELMDMICKSLKLAPPEEAIHGIAGAVMPASASRKRVLIAEDNKVNQRLAVRLLEKRGYSVTVVGNGRAAANAVAAERFHLVFMDVQMPEVDGLQATAEIRATDERTGAHTRIIAMTAHALKGDQERCLAAGMDGYVSKPIRVEELDEAIAAVDGMFREPEQIEMLT